MLEESSKLLAAYPALHLLFAALVGAVTIYGMWRADRGRRELPPQQQVPAETHMFFDGPVKVAIDHLAGIHNLLIKWDEQWQIEQKIADQLQPQADQRERSRWDDIFKIGRSIQDELARLAGRPRRG